ncbi:39S ribosomal protein L17, mitochondrial [Cimex lectularius]|uniref:Large ribosomal subunit protein bL17m n=1 Tax=Cimex lectularius TaxID=79782 RepID=A0A8I6RB20_CIMLE|nr:39S ribosomal protein L17, mitochondrial [Cimex lectularius]
MNQPELTHLVSRLRIRYNARHRNLKNPEGPKGRLDILKKIVGGLVKCERIQLNYMKADEARGYAERLISEAIRHGDKHTPTMEIANFWLEEKQLIHKLFKVLAPRFQNYTSSYTRMFKVASSYPDFTLPQAVLELKGNPFPSLVPDWSSNKNLLHNILLEAAKKDFKKEQLIKIAKEIPRPPVEPVQSREEVLPKPEA